VWVSGPLPGGAHDFAAARIWGIVRQLAAFGLVSLADKGYIGAGDHLRIRTAAGTSPHRRRRPSRPTPSSVPRPNAPRPSSRPGVSCANSATALARQATRQSHPRPPDPRERRMKRLIGSMLPARPRWWWPSAEPCSEPQRQRLRPIGPAVSRAPALRVVARGRKPGLFYSWSGGVVVVAVQRGYVKEYRPGLPCSEEYCPCASGLSPLRRST
jgi:hypothetical protein